MYYEKTTYSNFYQTIKYVRQPPLYNTYEINNRKLMYEDYLNNLTQNVII